MTVPTHQDDITIINIYVPNNRKPKYIKQNPTEMKGEIDNSTITVRYFKTTFSIIDRKMRQEISKENKDSNNSINQFDLTDIYIALHSTATEYTFSEVHNILHYRFYARP